MPADLNFSGQDVFMHHLGEICNSFDSQVHRMRDCIRKLQAEQQRPLPSLKFEQQEEREQSRPEATADDEIPYERMLPDDWLLSDGSEQARKPPQVNMGFASESSPCPSQSSPCQRLQIQKPASMSTDPSEVQTMDLLIEDAHIQLNSENAGLQRSRRQNQAEHLKVKPSIQNTERHSPDGTEHILETRDPACEQLAGMSKAMNLQVHMMWSVLEAKPAIAIGLPFRSALERSLKRLQGAVECFKDDMRLALRGHVIPEGDDGEMTASKITNSLAFRLSITPESVEKALEQRKTHHRDNAEFNKLEVAESSHMLSQVRRSAAAGECSMPLVPAERSRKSWFSSILPSALRQTTRARASNWQAGVCAQERNSSDAPTDNLQPKIDSTEQTIFEDAGEGEEAAPQNTGSGSQSANGFFNTSRASPKSQIHLKSIRSSGAPRTINANRISDMSISEWLAQHDGEDDEKRFCVDGVMHPEWNGRLGWDLMVIMLVLIDAMVLPFQMAYKDGDNPDGFDTIWLWLTTGFFGADFITNFFTGYMAGPRDPDLQPGKLVTSKFRIARNYARTWLSIDFVSTIPWSSLAEALTGGGGNSGSAQMAKLTKVVKFVRFLRLMRMLRLAKLATIWERIEARLGSLLLVQSTALFRVLFVMFAICHWNACIWWLIGQPTSLIIEVLDPETQKKWRDMPHWTTIVHTTGSGEWTWLERETSDAYIFCVYWTLGVMRTMPAEVQPTNKQERCYVLVFMFFAFSAFAICVALITQTFFKMSERKRLFGEDMAYLRMHLRKIKAKESLQVNVKDYLRHLFLRRKIVAKETNMLGHLPKALVDKLKFTKLQVHFDKLDCLRGLPPPTLALVMDISEVKDMVAGDLLCCWGCPAEAAWVLISGRLQVLGRGLHDRRTMGAEPSLKEGDLCEMADEECLVSSGVITSRRTIAVALCSEVLRIDKAKFFNLMKKTPFCEKVWREEDLRGNTQHFEETTLASSEAAEAAEAKDRPTNTTRATRDTNSLNLSDVQLEEADDFDDGYELDDEDRTGKIIAGETAVIMSS